MSVSFAWYSEESSAQMREVRLCGGVARRGVGKRASTNAAHGHIQFQRAARNKFVGELVLTHAEEKVEHCDRDDNLGEKQLMIVLTP